MAKKPPAKKKRDRHAIGRELRRQGYLTTDRYRRTQQRRRECHEAVMAYLERTELPQEWLTFDQITRVIRIHHPEFDRSLIYRATRDLPGLNRKSQK